VPIQVGLTEKRKTIRDGTTVLVRGSKRVA
jgi:hypothetical protein